MRKQLICIIYAFNWLECSILSEEKKNEKMKNMYEKTK